MALTVSILGGIVVGQIVYGILWPGYRVWQVPPGGDVVPRIWFAWEDAPACVECWHRGDFVRNFTRGAARFVAPRVGDVWGHKEGGYYPAGRTAKVIAISYDDKPSY